MKPDVIVIGAMKCASSTVCAFLEDHPDVYMVPRCEPNFFSHDENYAKGTSWYEEHFSARTNELLCGEGSNFYSARALYPKAAERIADYNPDIKIVYMVRDPMERILSAWIQNRADSGDEYPATVDRAVHEMPDLFIGQSLFWKNIEPYRALLAEEQIFVGFMEDLSTNPDWFFRQLCRFLGIAPYAAKRSHQNASIGKLVPSTTFTAINKFPGMDLLKPFIPTKLKRTLKTHLFSTRINKLPDFSKDVRAQVLEIVEPDARTFLDHYGKPTNFWKL